MKIPNITYIGENGNPPRPLTEYVNTLSPEEFSGFFGDMDCGIEFRPSRIEGIGDVIHVFVQDPDGPLDGPYEFECSVPMVDGWQRKYLQGVAESLLSAYAWSEPHESVGNLIAATWGFSVMRCIWDEEAAMQKLGLKWQHIKDNEWKLARVEESQ